MMAAYSLPNACRISSIRLRLTPKSECPARDAERKWITPALIVDQELHVIDKAEHKRRKLRVHVGLGFADDVHTRQSGKYGL